MAVSDLNILPVYRGGLIKINTGVYSCLYSCAVVTGDTAIDWDCSWTYKGV